MLMHRLNASYIDLCSGDMGNHQTASSSANDGDNGINDGNTSDKDQQGNKSESNLAKPQPQPPSKQVGGGKNKMKAISGIHAKLAKLRSRGSGKNNATNGTTTNQNGRHSKTASASATASGPKGTSRAAASKETLLHPEEIQNLQVP